MAHKQIADDEILRRLRLTDQEVRDMEAKFHAFANSLGPAQIRSLKKSTPKVADAAKTVGQDVTAERLEQFIRARAPKDATVVLFNQNNDHD